MLCSMRGIRWSSLILASPLAFRMNRRSRFSVVLRRTWHRKSWGRSSFVALQLISTLPEFFCLPFSVDNSLTKVKTTRSYTPRLWQVNLEFPSTFHLGPEVSLLNVCRSMPMIDQLQVIYGLIHGYRISIQQLTSHWYRIQAGNHTLPEAVAITSRQRVHDMERPNPTHFIVRILVAVILLIDQKLHLPINNILGPAMNHEAHRVKIHKP